MKFGTIFWSAWALIGTLVRFNSTYDRDSLPLLGFILVAYGPLAVYRGYVAWSSSRVLDAAKEFQKNAGSPTYTHFENGSGIAIDPAASTLTLRAPATTLMGEPTTKTYPFSDVREWTNAHSTPATFIPMGGVANGLAAGAASLGAAARAAAETGFFIKVRDVQHPEWRVAMAGKRMRDSWTEILEQEINERRRNTA